jgi:tRNA A37 threonylcarbamoyladenosine biosynthesis protein TsaE
VVEWADRTPGVFPSELLEVCIEHDEDQRDGRTLTLTAFGDRYADLLQYLIAAPRRPSGAASKARPS